MTEIPNNQAELLMDELNRLLRELREVDEAYNEKHRIKGSLYKARTRLLNHKISSLKARLENIGNGVIVSVEGCGDLKYGKGLTKPVQFKAFYVNITMEDALSCAKRDFKGSISHIKAAYLRSGLEIIENH